MRFVPYILKHLRRNWIRTASTVLAIAISVFFITTLQTVLAAVDIALGATSSSRLVTRHAVSLTFNIPISYKERIVSVPGVRQVAVDTWFGGVVGGATEGGDSFRNFFNNLAVEAEPFLSMYPEFQIPEDQRRAFLEDLRGCVIGRGLARRFGWKIGDVFQLESFIPPYRKREPFEFVVRAIYDVDKQRYPGFDDMTMLFHWKYLREGTGREVGTSMYVVQIDNPDDAGRIGRTIDAVFENSDSQTRTETEQAFAAGFVAMAGNLGLLLNLIGVAVTFTILLVTANTMSMAVRERRTEIAVLKTIGFSSAAVMLLVLGEALVLAAAGGGVGLALAWGGAQVLKSAPMLGPILGVVPEFGLPARVAAIAVGLTLFLGLAAGIVPAALAYRARVTEILRQV